MCLAIGGHGNGLSREGVQAKTRDRRLPKRRGCGKRVWAMAVGKQVWQHRGWPESAIV